MSNSYGTFNEEAPRDDEAGISDALDDELPDYQPIGDEPIGREPTDDELGDDELEDEGSGAATADGRLPETARRALVTLLTHRYITRSRNKSAWTSVLTYEHDLRARLDEMYLDLVVDHDAEVAFKRQQVGDDVPRLLRREKALNRDATFVLLFLVREYAFADGDDEPVVVSRDQIGEFLRAFREEGDSDGAKFDRRVDAAINALTRPLQLLIPDPATEFLFTVSPVVVPLIGTDEVARLEAAFQEEIDKLTGDERADGRRTEVVTPDPAPYPPDHTAPAADLDRDASVVGDRSVTDDAVDQDGGVDL